jgi:hypothetical protein
MGAGDLLCQAHAQHGCFCSQGLFLCGTIFKTGSFNNYTVVYRHKARGGIIVMWARRITNI